MEIVSVGYDIAFKGTKLRRSGWVFACWLHIEDCGCMHQA